jgi:outer membrane protein
MKKISLSVLLICLLIFGLNAQVKELWSLEKCINFALENNIQVKRQELQSELAQKDYTQSFFNFTPSINAGFEHSISAGGLNTELYTWVDTKQTYGQMGVRGELTLFNGLQNYNTMALRKYSFLSSKADLEKTKNDITLLIMNYYLQILFDEELLEVSKSQYDVTLLQVEKTKRMVEVGNVAMGQLYEIQAQAATEKLNFTVKRNTLQLSVLDLVQLLDLDSIGNFAVLHPENLAVENSVLPATINDALANALQNMPEIKSSEYNVLSSQKNLAVQRGGRSPQIYLNGLYSSRYQNDSYNPHDSSFNYPAIDQLHDKIYSQITIGVSVPIFNRYLTQTSISKAKISLADSKFQLEQQKQVLYKNIQQAHTDALGAFEKYQSALEAVKSNEEAFNYTQQKYEVGLVNAVDFSIAKTNYSKARSDLAQAKYEYIFKVKILDFYSGKPIQL